MMLVEIIRGAKTGDAAVAKALDFVRQIRKDADRGERRRFFYANRCIIPYINEGIRMVAEGVEPALVENAAKLVGMPLACNWWTKPPSTLGSRSPRPPRRHGRRLPR